MTNDTHDDSVRERLEDFFQDFEEAQLRCEHLLIELEQSPDSPGIPEELFRALQSIRDALLYAGMRELTPLAQVLEQMIDAIRTGSVVFDAMISDVFLVALDRLHAAFEEHIQGQSTADAQPALEQISLRISQMLTVKPAERGAAAHDVLTRMDPALDLATPSPATQPAPPVISGDDGIEAILEFFGIAVDADLRFFISMNIPLEARSLFWKGRTARQLNLALAMNQDAGNPVSKEQLAAAVMLHDIGMAFLPVELLHAKGQLSPEALALLQGHPHQAHTLMTPLKRWHEAAQAIAQHHERMDGNGYPSGLSGDEICDAARILAIVDTFEARTHERAHTHMTKRPFIRAILEINSCAGSQFDTRWVGHFNQVARAMTSHDKR